ncbi:hypothetical protein DNU06_07830 [Putridiphycobacter roseus]|uniref:TonB C-terminal domain-containing protein n=1 Tax=Putridiphycobacter roseus TaxID=2219161 RepID=A0A2W1N2H0_9FLAO|nr:M56 family metallopeptidase [Putridiphycobacter roseus]PZE17730.1 hypothetical protein DNU06_07830 [Putridiphycobacter roseus]
MNNLIYNFMELNVVIVFLYAIYILVYKQLSFGLQRKSMLFIPLLAFLSLFIKNTLLTASTTLSVGIPMVYLDVIAIAKPAKNATVTFWSLESIYLTITVLLFCWLLYRIIKVLFFFKKAQHYSKWNARILISPLNNSFSFFNFIHLSADLDKAEKKVVLEHELYHTRLKHAYDLLVMAIYQVLFWINPIFFFMKKKLIEIQEYEVDNSMYQKYENQYVKHLLALTFKGQSAHYLLTSQFYNGLSLTKRTKQMKTEKKNKWALLIIFPLLATGFTLLSLKNDALTIENGNEFALDQDTVVFVDTIYDKVDKHPEYIGGDQAMIQYIAKNIVYPKGDKDAGIEGTVYCEFVVQKDGSLDNVKIVKGKSPTLDAEVIRVISSMPKWIPGEFKKEKVAVRYTIPVKFMIPKKINE